MPLVIGTPSSQGAVVAFDGTAIGRLRSFNLQPATAVLEEVTNVESPIIGSGFNSRIVREYECTAIDPGGMDISMYGSPWTTHDFVGKTAALSLTAAGATYSKIAFLERFDVSGSVGEFLQGTARFRFVGKDF